MMTASLSVLVPKTITEAMFISSTAVEPGPNEIPWDPAHSYSIGDRVFRPTTHAIYENLIPGVNGLLPEAAPDRWSLAFPSNKWALFDSTVSTQSAVNGALTIVLRPGFFNAICLFGLDAGSIEVTVKDAPGGNVIFHYFGALENSLPGDYYEYFFSPYKPQKDIVLSGIEPYASAELTVTLSGNTVNKCGTLAVGDLRPLGKTVFGAKVIPKSTSGIDIDKWGNSVIVKRRSGKDMSVTANVAKEEANTVLDTIVELLDVPACWIGTDMPEYSGLRSFGLCKGDLTYQEGKCVLNLNILGLV